MGAVKKDVLLILHIISITRVGEVLWIQVTVSIRRVWTRSLDRSEASHAANNTTMKIKEHVSRKCVWRVCDQGPFGRKGAPLMVSGASRKRFAFALSWMPIRIRCPIIQVPLPEVHNKPTKINGLTIQQPFLEQVGLCETVHCRKDVGWPTIIAPWAQLHVSFKLTSCKIYLAVELLLRFKALYSRTAARDQLNYRGPRPPSRMTHHEGVVSLTIKILLSTVSSHSSIRLSISLPCRKNGVAQTWLAFIPAWIEYVLSHLLVLTRMSPLPSVACHLLEWHW